MKKRILSMLLAALMVVSLLPVTAWASGGDPNHTHGAGPDAITFETKITTADELVALFTSGGSGYLANDITTGTTLTVVNSKTVNLCLNGHVITMNGNVIIVESGATLNLYDCDTTVTNFKQSEGDEYSRYWIKDPNGDKSVTGGYILGGTNLNNTNGLIQVNGGTFNMYGGTVVGTKNSWDGWSTAGVWVQTGTFNMHGGAFKGCNARDGVIETSGTASATVNIYNGALIENCTSFNCAGAIFLRGNTEFYMYGGTIKDCVAKDHGGAINAKGVNCNVYLYGGEIVNNEAGSFGGGVCIEDSDVHVTVGGNIEIAGNKRANGQADNLWLGGGNSISLGTGENVPREGMHIGVTLAGGTGTFVTSGTVSNMQYFTSDDSVYAMQCVSNHLELVKSWTALQNALNGAATQTIEGLFEIDNDTIKLLTDFKADTGDTTLTVSGTKTLDLNGHVINGKISDSTSVGSVITVNSGANLTLNNSNPNVAHYFDYVVDGAWTLNTTATEGTPIESLTDRPTNGTVIKVYGGCITGGKTTSDGGGIDVYGTLTVSGGNIIGNQACKSGGGVRADATNSSIDIQGGAIVGNKAAENGGGVFAAGGSTLEMSGGSVLFNTANGCGGITVHRGSNFTMSGGDIIGNKGNDQGGVFLSKLGGNFTMTGGIIKNNIGVQYGGVYSEPGTNNNKVMTIGGTAKIIDNKLTDGTVSNFYLSDGTTVTLGAGGDAPKDGMHIGVTTQTPPTNTAPVKFTTTATDVQNSNYFFSDNDSYIVQYNATGCYLELHVHNIVQVHGQAPSESASGWKDHYKCDCGAYYEDANGSTPIADLSAWKAEGGNGYIAPLIHGTDRNKDHICDYCGRTVSDHTDTDPKDHICDYCGKTVSECADSDKDHKCDLCGKVLSECADEDKDHKCDICGKVLSECADEDKDHKCDICGKTLSECADSDKDHKCDICGKVLSECADDNKDHKCDYCGKVLSECADDNKDHKCDYCGKVLSECADSDKDHKCDLCGKIISEHEGVLCSGVAPTQEKAGYKDHYTCFCGKIFEDKECTVEIEDLKAWKSEGGRGYIAPLPKEKEEEPAYDPMFYFALMEALQRRAAQPVAPAVEPTPTVEPVKQEEPATEVEEEPAEAEIPEKTAEPEEPIVEERNYEILGQAINEYTDAEAAYRTAQDSAAKTALYAALQTLKADIENQAEDGKLVQSIVAVKLAQANLTIVIPETCDE